MWVTLKASRSCTGRSLMKPTVSDMMADAPLGSVTACNGHRNHIQTCRRCLDSTANSHELHYIEGGSCQRRTRAVASRVANRASSAPRSAPVSASIRLLLPAFV